MNLKDKSTIILIIFYSTLGFLVGFGLGIIFLKLFGIL